ncbi:hypothetical protein RHOFW104T7_00265 [Rhodanobacter thiooxydans]|uniref:Uncharacterized protein n=1 Tax=Rhodanobacter thiooxydans TaxID=416169 RepID=A0A154QE71_9GAMM|nr:hypothetical protein UUA_17842 [Rhodanobacter thiooxydans LCS2]KZC22522.1 hypothetical protein RHOFW104T7_00265 [Rhodanobacter thiooxydans]
MRPSFHWLVVLLVLLMASVGFWSGIIGIIDGAVTFPSKRESFIVVQAQSPKVFWGCVAAWLSIGVGMVWLAFTNIRELLARA